MFGTLCVAITCILFAIPISPNTSYWAYAFPAKSLSVLGADTLFPCLVLFVAHSLPREDQSLGGAMINAMGQVGRAIGLAICTAIQLSVQNSREEAAMAFHNVLISADIGPRGTASVQCVAALISVENRR